MQCNVRPPDAMPVLFHFNYYYYEIVREYTIKKEKRKSETTVSSTQKINHAINVLAVEKRR